MHYYQFNIGDYRRDTAHLSRLEHGIYRDLIDWYYLEESPIPLETQSVMRRLRLATQEEAQALKNVLSDFFTEADGWRHSRIDQDIRDYHAMAEKNKENGKLGGRPRKTQSVSNGMPDETQSKGNQEPLTNNQESKTKPDAAKAARFDPLTLEIGSVPTEAWGRWIAYRRSRKLTVSEATMRAQVENLNAWLQNGHPPSAVIAKSIENGWQGLFEPKEGGAGPPLSQFISHADQSKLAAARTIFGTEIEGNHGSPNGNIIDITPTSRSLGSQDFPGNAGQLRVAVPKSVEDWPITA